MKTLAFLIIILALTMHALTQSCHYSCKTCSGRSYAQCLTCSDTSKSIQYGVTCDSGDQAVLSQIGGYCGDSAYSKANPLGAILIILGILAGVFLKSQYVFYFILSMQTLGLAGLIEVGFNKGISTLLGSFDYFMLFSIMQQNTKPQNCKLMLRSMYRLNDFLGNTNFAINSPPIFAIAFLLTILLAIGSLMRAFRKEKCSSISDETLDHILLGLRTFLLFIMQQIILIIYVGIRFSPLTPGLIFLIILQCIGLIYLIVDCNLHPLPFFKSTETMNITFVKRLLLPALVVLPYQFSYSLIIFLVGFNLIELLFTTKIEKVKVKKYVYIVLELLCIFLIGGFTISDTSNNNESQAISVAIFTSISLIVYCFVFIVEIGLAVKKKLKGNKISNEEWNIERQFSQKNSSLRDRQDTISDINQGDPKSKKQPVKSKLRDSLNAQKVVVVQIE